MDCKLGRYFALRASAGATFTVLGAQLRFRESYYHPVLATDMIMEADQSSSDSTVTGTLGYFVAGELEWFMTKRTGMFLGGIHESYARDLKIRLGSQTAEIAANAGTAFRAGFTTHF